MNNSQKEVKIAWRQRFEKDAATDYGRAHDQLESDAQYIQGVSMYSRLYGMNSFKEALREAIKKKINSYPDFQNRDMAQDYAHDELKAIIELIDTVTPR